SWSWWSNEDVTRYNNVTPFIDLAQQMGWEYSLVDVGWNQMTAAGGGTWQNLVTYAAGKNVSLLFWYNSGGTNSTVNMAPRDRMSSQTTRRTEMNTISTAGVKGIKVDFFHADKQWIMKYYIDILRDAAQYKLAVNFHGCTVPRGWQRTWPNLMSMESVRGAEYYKYDGGYPARQPARNTILPFTRNAVASMDYTPVTFTNMANAHATTYGHELALSVVFESGIQHFADRVSAYNATPANVRNFLSGVPVAWDNTRHLLGAPGTYLVLARQKGRHWYVGGINGQGSTQSVTVPLSFLVPGVRYQMLRIADGTSNTTFGELLDTVVSTESITISMRSNGGFVARLVNIDAVAVAPDLASRENSGRQGSMLVTAAGVITLPAEFAGKRLTVRLFDLNGKLVKTAQIQHRRSVDPVGDFGCAPGVHIVKIAPVR
ncbi:MAG: glycoside hydrolase family 97 catalytic domain-containing protein, partial [Chitinispirillaceae bacterium]|nr:glycoside hydrolase family 97 catalytic domain-containing protein [Chitinispirillaceae bacterium]